MKRAGGLTALVVLLAGLGWVAGGPAVADPQLPSQVRVSGVVVAGVETGCLLLVADADPDDPDVESSPFLLLGGDVEVIVPGARLLVIGELVSGVMSPCKQGRPLRVSFTQPLQQ
jgi:hypothetical protein